jgi:GT2 family glycosyltransferase
MMSAEMVKATLDGGSNIKSDVVVVVFNPPAIAVDSLKSLRQHSNGLGKIILVDNFSQRNLDRVDKCRELADEYIRPPKQVSLAAAWNLGIGQSTTPYVVITNDDIIYTHDWLLPIIDGLQRRSDIGVLQPYNTLSGLPTGFPHNYKPEDKIGEPPLSNFVGCCFAINKAIYPKLKEFDHQRWPEDLDYTYFYEPFYPFGSEDQDFYRRVRAAGFGTKTHFGSYIHHFTGQTMSTIPTFENTKAESMRKYNERWNNVPDTWHDERPE